MAFASFSSLHHAHINLDLVYSHPKAATASSSTPTSPCAVSLSLPRRKYKSTCDELANAGVLKWRTRASFFAPFLKKISKSRETLKEELLEAITPLDRGAEATPADQERVDQIASELEAVSSVKEPLKSNLLNGKWELLYTTSRSILQSQRPKILRPNGKIYQSINVDTLRAQNMETWPFFNQVVFAGNGQLSASKCKKGSC